MTAAAVEPTRNGAGVPSTKEAAADNSSGSPTRVLPEARDKARHDAKYDKKMVAHVDDAVHKFYLTKL